MALVYLSSQNWRMAQQMFLKNVKDNPSHETYNNLGNYLIHEGFTRKDGNVKSAKRLGLIYLQRAAKISSSSTNFCAIAKAYDFKLRRAVGLKRVLLYQKTYESLIAAYSITPTNEILYNILRIQILTDAYDETILENINKLLEEFVCEESVRLYFEMLRLCSLYNEGIECIRRYREFLSPYDILLFYAKHKIYDKGYDLCRVVSDQYSPDKYISAAIIECCINTGHLEEANLYARYAEDVEKSICYSGKRNWCKQVFSNLRTTDALRNELISSYLSIPPFFDMCYYFA